MYWYYLLGQPYIILLTYYATVTIIISIVIDIIDVVMYWLLLTGY